VEDDPATSRALRLILGRKGWDVVVAKTLAEARTLLLPAPQGVVLDLMLPDGDGASLLAEIRDNGLPTRVVVTTGVNDPDRLAAVRALLPTAVLTKPITLPDLLRALDPQN